MTTFSVRTIKNNWRGAQTLIDGNVRGAVRKTTIELLGEITARIIDKDLIDTGNYLRSWDFAIEPDGKRAEVGSPVEYGPVLEYGSRDKSRPARAHVVPAADWVRVRVVEYFRNLERR